MNVAHLKKYFFSEELKTCHYDDPRPLETSVSDFKTNTYTRYVCELQENAETLKRN